MRPPGRNDPCPCGSGRKYKHCCLIKPRDPEAAYQETHRFSEIVRAKLIDFGERPEFASQRMDAYHRFFGDQAATSSPVDHERFIGFLDWYLHGYRTPGGESVIDQFLRQRGWAARAGERAILEAWRHTRPGLYQVREIHPDRGALLDDVLRGGQVTVRDVTLSRTTATWDILAARVLDVGGQQELSGSVLTMGAAHLEEVRAYAESELEAYRIESPGADWDAFLDARFERLHHFSPAENRPALVTSEGDPVCFSEAVYDVSRGAWVEQLLDSLDVLDRDPPYVDSPDVVSYSWTEPWPEPSSRPRGKSAPSAAHGDQPDMFGDRMELSSEVMRPGEGPTRSLGTVELQGGRLVLQCMSRERLARGRKMLESAFRGELRHRADSFQSVEDALASPRDEPATPSRIPPEIEAEIVGRYYDQHYATWPDVPLPALDGLTPREAAVDPTARGKLEDLLRVFENQESRARAQGHPAYETAKLRRALGMGAGRAAPESPSVAKISWPNAPKGREADLDAATETTRQLLETLWRGDEEALVSLLVPGQLAATLVDSFDVEALGLLAGDGSGFADSKPTQAEFEGDAISIEVERKHLSDASEPIRITVLLREYRKRWRVDRVTPLPVGKRLGSAMPSDPIMAAVVSGEELLPPREGAARDDVEVDFLTMAPSSGLSILQQASGLRIWRDFLRRFQRTATLTPGQESSWAAALDYVVRVLESRPGSQASVARQYGVSPASLSANYRQIVAVLHLQHIDPRYSIAPSRSSLSMAALKTAFGGRPLRFGAGRGRSFH